MARDVTAPPLIGRRPETAWVADAADAALAGVGSLLLLAACAAKFVDMHVRNILSKLNCKTRTEAASRAAELGLLTR